MADQLKEIEFKQLGGGYPGAETLRLIALKDGLTLVVSHTSSTPPLGAQTVFASMGVATPGGAWRNVATVNQIVPAQPDWDCAADAGGRVQIALERPGGAMNALELHLPSGEVRSLSSDAPLKSFSSPRFARAAAPAWVTATVDNRACVAIPLAAPGPSIGLAECEQGLLVSLGPAGSLFLSKKTVPGPVRGNSIRPGDLSATTLDQNLKPVGPPVAVVGPVFQFDAALVGDKVAVVATTPRGLIVASRELKGSRFQSKPYLTSMEILSPAITPAANGSIGVYGLASGEKGQVLAAVLPLP